MTWIHKIACLPAAFKLPRSPEWRGVKAEFVPFYIIYYILFFGKVAAHVQVVYFLAEGNLPRFNGSTRESRKRENVIFFVPNGPMPHVNNVVMGFSETLFFFFGKFNVYGEVSFRRWYPHFLVFISENIVFCDILRIWFVHIIVDYSLFFNKNSVFICIYSINFRLTITQWINW